MNPTVNPADVQWRKSSRSAHQGGDCVEVADLTPWRKSSRSAHEGGDCVEVADLAAAIGVRDSKDPDGPKLTFGRAAFAALAGEIRAAENA